MDRVSRRWWTWGLTVLAAPIILAAFISGLFQIAVYMLPTYREDISGWVTDVAGRPVQIGGVSLVWRGIYPRLDFSDITLYDETGENETLTAQRLSLGFSFMRLLAASITPNRIELSGLTLQVETDENGHWRIAGFDAAMDDGQDHQALMRKLLSFDRLRVEDCTLVVTAPKLSGGAPMSFVLDVFDAHQTLRGFDVDAEMTLPSAYGEKLSLEADIHGEPAMPDSWSGTVSGEASGLLLQPWLRGRVAPGTAVGADVLGAEYEGRLEGGKLTSLGLQVEGQNLIIARAGETLELESLEASAKLVRTANQWQLDLEQFLLDGESLLQGSVRYLPEESGAFALNMDADHLHFSKVMPFLQFARDAEWRQLAALSGSIEQLVLRWQQAPETPPHFSVRAGLQNVAWSQGTTQFSGLSGQLSASESGGRLDLAQVPLKLTVPAFDEAVDFEEISGSAQWKRLAGAWQVSMPSYTAKLRGGNAQGKFELKLPDDAAQSPVLDLSTYFHAPDAVPFKAYIPKIWGPGLHEWLTRGIVGGRVARGELLIRGPLHDFPFHQVPSGEWKLDIDVADGRLNYFPGWPQVENATARLHFKGNSLLIESQSGTVLGNRVENVKVQFKDFSDGWLSLDVQTQGEIASQYQFLRQSPLRQILSGLIDHTRAAGRSKVAVHVDIPLVRGREIAVNGTVSVSGAQMYYQGLDEPINAITGTVAFNEKGVTADKLTARFADVDVAGRIEARNGTHGVVIGEFPYTLRADGGGISAFVPELIRKQVSGESRWRMELPIAAKDTALHFTSDLRGAAVNMPAPVGKTADEAVPIAVRIDVQGAPRVRVDYADRLGALVTLAAADGPAASASAAVSPRWKVSGVNLRLGAGEALTEAPPGLNVSGHSDTLDLGAWLAALQGAQGVGLELRDATLHADQWLFRNQVLRDTSINFTPEVGGWRARLSGNGAEGEVTSNAARITARFKRLDLQTSLAKEIEQAVAARLSAVLQPADWPALDLSAEALRFNGNDMGELKMATSRTTSGLQLDRLNLSGKLLQANATGHWQRTEGESLARLKFDLASTDVATVLQVLGYAPNISGKQSTVKGDLSWTPAAGGLDWAMARGRINFNFESGSLKAVEPGAGRVLGLFNFYAIPRRFILDFRDVVSSGLGYDRITGSFDLADGSAVTQDLKLTAPSLRMEMRGRVGLAAQDYDQRVSVYPDVSAGVTVGATLLGGPAAGVIALLAQQILGQPLDGLTELNYRIIGPWDNPQVLSGSDATTEKSQATPAR